VVADLLSGSCNKNINAKWFIPDGKTIANVL